MARYVMCVEVKVKDAAGKIIGKRMVKAPGLRTLERWADDGVAEAADGCRVEPDGRCVHGYRSWLLVLGLI